MATTSVYVLATSVVNTPNGPIAFEAGELVSDLGNIALLAGAGIPVFNSSDPKVSAAAARAQALRSKGADERIITELMVSSVAQLANSTEVTNQPGAIGANAGAFTYELVNGVLTRDATITDAYLIVNTAAAAGESAVVQMKKNGSNLGSALTYDNTKTAKTRLPLTTLIGVQLSIGDALEASITYVAGGGPALGTSPSGNYQLVLVLS